MTTNTIPIRGEGGWDDIADEYLREIIAARGSAASLNARMSVAINDDGTLKSPTPASGWWTQEPDTIVYSSDTTFTVSGDKTAIYLEDRAIKASVTAGMVYSHVLSSTYDSGTGLTTVTLRDAVLDNGLSAIYYGQIPKSAPAPQEVQSTSDATLSGTPVVIEIRDHDGNSYYFKAYPVKS